MFDGSVSIAHAIQLAVAPVFLLTGITAMLGVLSNRLARIVDRARLLQNGAHGPSREGELSLLGRRARLIHRAIGLCTGAAVLVAVVVAVIFVGFSLSIRTAPAVAFLFVLAMTVFILGLLLFLREVQLATRTVEFGANSAPEESPGGRSLPVAEAVNASGSLNVSGNDPAVASGRTSKY